MLRGVPGAAFVLFVACCVLVDADYAGALPLIAFCATLLALARHRFLTATPMLSATVAWRHVGKAARAAPGGGGAGEEPPRGPGAADECSTMVALEVSARERRLVQSSVASSPTARRPRPTAPRAARRRRLFAVNEAAGCCARRPPAAM